MDLFYAALGRVFDDVERRDSGPAHMDKTGEEYYAAESEVTEDRADWADSMFGVELSAKAAPKGDELDDAIEAAGGSTWL